MGSANGSRRLWCIGQWHCLLAIQPHEIEFHLLICHVGLKDDLFAIVGSFGVVIVVVSGGQGSVLAAIKIHDPKVGQVFVRHDILKVSHVDDLAAIREICGSEINS
ncbi:hypothetical protein NYZ99_11570 [Maribacter litopenaei]|uniref:Uncharacterized protein n=1 Tax=Maribacter litopenaei TaxID=2976127 RepID=A0ABY5Y4J1_9FLAO|nr:hypothetical protein [Maribacter litopenaei]UWX53778.1 hypothetical protein NYZ99_11570 [Maribacter litopenaei]